MDRFARQVRLGLRMLRKSPVFSGTAILLVALGVGAVTAIFTMVDHILLRPLPYPDAERLVTVANGSHSGPFYRNMQTLQTVERWAAAYDLDVNLTSEGDPQRMREARVSEGFFDLMGASPIRGRLLVAEDFGVAGPVVVSAGLWRRVWGEDPDLIGRAIVVDGEPLTVVGIVEPGFSPPEALVDRSIDLWRPIDWGIEPLNSDDFHMLEVVGRLSASAAVETADAELEALVGRLALASDQFRNRDGTTRDIPVEALSEATVRGVRSGLGLLLAAVGLLLLVACANVAHLFLARGLARHREMAVRRALGAGSGTLVGQLMVESAIVGVSGGLLGLVFAQGGLQLFLALNPEALPRESAVGLDLRVLGFAVLLSLGTAVLFGLLPAVRSVAGDVADELRGAGRSATQGRGIGLVRGGLVAVEIALSLVLIAGAGLLLRTFVEVQSQPPGFEVADLWTVPLVPREAESPAEYVEQMGAVRDAVARVPGVRSVAYGLTLPMEMTGGGRCCWRTRFDAPEGDGDVLSMMHPVSLTYFETLGIPLLSGRAWTRAEAPVDPMPVVLSEPLAIELFGGADAAVNRSFEFREGEPVTVVGVVADNRHYGLDAEHGPAAYLPIERVPFRIPRAHLAVRVGPGSEAGLSRSLREAVWSVAPTLPVPTVRSMSEWIARSSARRRFDSAIFGSFAGVALLLAAAGLYGTLLYLAGQRRRELAIRLALGASRGRIERRMLAGGLWVASLGVGVGLGAAWATGRFLESRLWGVQPGDPFALAGAALLLLTTAALASWLPARVAARTDPMEALQAE